MSWITNLFKRKPKTALDRIAGDWDAVSIYDGPDLFLEQFARLPEYRGHILATGWVQSEVGNGGFSQLFFNNTGVLAPEAVLGFRALGMPQAAEVVAQAMAIFGEDYPRERVERVNWFGTEGPGDLRHDYLAFHRDANGDGILSELNDRFFELLRTEAGGLHVAVERYAAENEG